MEYKNVLLPFLAFDENSAPDSSTFVAYSIVVRVVEFMARSLASTAEPYWTTIRMTRVTKQTTRTCPRSRNSIHFGIQLLPRLGQLSNQLMPCSAKLCHFLGAINGSQTRHILENSTVHRQVGVVPLVPRLILTQ